MTDTPGIHVITITYCPTVLIKQPVITILLHQVRHGKTDYKVFVVVIPKEGLAGGALPILPLVWHRLQIYNLQPSQIIFYSQCTVGVVPKEGLAGSLGMTMTKILRRIFSWHSSHQVNRVVLSDNKDRNLQYAACLRFTTSGLIL